MACLGSRSHDQNQDTQPSVSGLSPKHPSPHLSWAAPPTGWGGGLPCDEGSKEAEHGQQDLVADPGQDVHEGGV